LIGGRGGKKQAFPFTSLANVGREGGGGIGGSEEKRRRGGRALESFASDDEKERGKEGGN